MTVTATPAARAALVRSYPAGACGVSAPMLRLRSECARPASREARGMLNDRIDIVQMAGGDAVQFRFDLADAELLAIARSLETVVHERCQGVELDAGAVLELRELVAIGDSALERAQDGYAGGTLVLGLPRLEALIGALGEWCWNRQCAGFLRHDEHVDLPLVEGVIPELRALLERAALPALA